MIIYLEASTDFFDHGKPVLATVEIDPDSIVAIMHPTEKTMTRIYLANGAVFSVTNTPDHIRYKMNAATEAATQDEIPY